MFHASKIAISLLPALLGITIPLGAAAQNSYQVVSLTQAGTITGTVKWSGPLPHIAVFPIDKDPQICDPDSKKTRDLERLIVGPENGVANTVVFLKDISRGKPLEIPEARGFLDQKRCRYEPHILLVPANGPLALKSSDAVLHTVHMDGAATYNLPFPFTDRTITRNMPTAGLVNVRCNGGHSWMNAEILVVSHPYYAVTDESGSFELTDVPPGKYEIVAWHEGWKLDREEAAFDVLTERKVKRPIFSDPKTWEKQVTVGPDATVVVNFALGEK
jgi:Polysaccharide lyase family 4, domain II